MYKYAYIAKTQILIRCIVRVYSYFMHALSCCDTMLYAGRVVSDSILVEGEFIAGKLHGVGRRALENGTVYEGECACACVSCRRCCGMFSSFFTSILLHLILGEFADGRRHGCGVLRTGTGETQDGVWFRGKLQELPSQQKPMKAHRKGLGAPWNNHSYSSLRR